MATRTVEMTTTIAATTSTTEVSKSASEWLPHTERHAHMVMGFELVAGVFCSLVGEREGEGGEGRRECEWAGYALAELASMCMLIIT